jgi:hypothetical protein
VAGVGLGRDGAEAAGLVVLEGLDELGAGVHHERPVGGDRLADRLAAQDEDVELLMAALLGAVGGHADDVARTVASQLAHGHRVAPGPNRPRPGEHVHQRVEVGPPRQPQLGPGSKGGVQQRDRGVGDPRALVAGDLAGDHPQQGAAVGGAQQGHRPATDVLVAGRGQLQPGRQVDPELEAVEQPAFHHDLLGRSLNVEDPATGSDPVNVALGDEGVAPARGWQPSQCPVRPRRIGASTRVM